MGDDFVRYCEKVGGITLTSSMSKIIEFLALVQEAYHPKLLAKRLRLNYDTARRYCLTLSKRHLLERETIGGFICYRVPSHLLAQLPRSEEVKYHGFTMRCRTPWKLQLLKKGKWKEDLYCYNGSSQEITFTTHQVGQTARAEWVGVVHFQHEGGSLMVYYGQTGRPLSLVEYEGFCKWLGGYCGCEVFNGWPEWGLSQVGVGIDGMKVHFDRFDKKGTAGSVSIADFHGNVSRYYDKALAGGEEVYRREVHLNFAKNHAPPNVLMEQAMANLQGGVPNISMVNMLAMQNQRIDQLTDQLGALTASLTKFMQWQMQHQGG